MEYAEGGELFDYIIKKDHLSEDETRNIFHQIIDSIDYMHKLGISHRDLKPENILLDSSHTKIKIIDFGLSNLYYTFNNNNIYNFDNINCDENNLNDLDIDLLQTPCGSPGYAPPEMVLGYSYNGLLTDIWSSGIILYAMLCGSFPFDDECEQNLYSKIIKGEYNFPDDIVLSNEAKNLVNKILVVNPNYRASISDIKNDPWFKKDYQPIYGLFLPIQEIPIDNLIVEEMEKNGFKKEEIIKNVKNNRHNEITTFYYLLVNKFSRSGFGSVNDLISPCFIKYISEQNEKIKDLANLKYLINLKSIFEKLRFDEAEKMVKKIELEMKQKQEKESIKEIYKSKDFENISNIVKKEKKKEKIKEDVKEKEKEKEKGKEKEKESEKEKEKVKEKENQNQNENEKEQQKKEEIINNITKKANKNEIKNKFFLETNSKKDVNFHQYINNFSNKIIDYKKKLNNSNASKIKEYQIKNVRNIILNSLNKNKKFKKLQKTNRKKEKSKKNLKNLKISSYSLERNSHSNNNKELRVNHNKKKNKIINTSNPCQEYDIGNSDEMEITSKREKNCISQGINSSRNTDRINYEKYFSINPVVKSVIKKRDIPLFHKFTLNCKDNKNGNKKRKFKSNQRFINKVVKNSKTTGFSSYYLNENLNLKNNYSNTNYTNSSIKNIVIKNPLGKNISIQKEKGNMSYRQIKKDKISFENNFSKKYTVSEGKSNSHSKGKDKLHISTPFNNTSRNNILNNKNKINKINVEKIENNWNNFKNKNYLLENKDRNTQELKNTSNKSNENNSINFSININFNVNQIKNTLKEALKEREKTNPSKKNKIKSLKGMKLDLKKINNNHGHIINRNSLSNSERMNNENSLKIKQYSVLNRKTNYISNEKILIKSINSQISNNSKGKISHSKEEYKIKSIGNKTYRNQDHKQKSFINQNQKFKILKNSLTKLFPFLKSMNSLKTKSLKKKSPNLNSKGITFTDNSNSTIIKKVNANNILNNNIPNQKIKVNSKIQQIKQNKKFLNSKFLKNITNNSYLTEMPFSHYNFLNQERNSSKKSPVNANIKMKPLNLKGIINESKNSYTYKCLTMRGEQPKNKILISIKDELSKNENNNNKNQTKDGKCSINLITRVSPNKNMINNDAIFDLTPFKIRDILLKQLPKYNIIINQKISKNNYFVFHCIRGLLKIIIELSQIKGTNFIFVHMKFFSGNQKDFFKLRNQILGIIHNYQNISLL